MGVSLLAGILALVVALASWGSAFVPTKLPSIVSVNLDVIVFQSYVTLATILTTLVVLVWKPFVFTVLGFFGAALWIPANIMAITAIKHVGVGVAQSVWGGGICITSFLWGALGRPLWAGQGCTLASPPLSILGLFLLVAGIAGLAFASTPTKTLNGSSVKAGKEEGQVDADEDDKEGEEKIGQNEEEEKDGLSVRMLKIAASSSSLESKGLSPSRNGGGKRKEGQRKMSSKASELDGNDDTVGLIAVHDEVDDGQDWDDSTARQGSESDPEKERDNKIQESDEGLRGRDGMGGAMREQKAYAAVDGDASANNIPSSLNRRPNLGHQYRPGNDSSNGNGNGTISIFAHSHERKRKMLGLVLCTGTGG